MNKKSWIVLIVIFIVAISVGIYFYFFNPNKQNNQYEATKSSTKEKSEEQKQENKTNSEEVNKEDKKEDKKTTEEPTKEVKLTEQALSNFSTKIYSKDSARQNNISITCKTLNSTVVKKGGTFSFCNTVGKATSDKGYEEADIFDRNGNKQKGLGGGNCQISSTLYNAVLSVSSLVVTERHEHSNDVPYVKKGKDAAVAYGSYDFKFRNNSEYDIKIYAESNSDSVTIKLVSLIPEK